VSKRILDFIPAAVGLFLLSSLLLLVALLIKLDSPGLVFVGQEHMANGLRPFRIYKFRTMVRDTSRRAGPIPFGVNSRITWVGRVLCKTKIDDLPQLINVLRGEISFVSPRPEVRQYVEWFREHYD
jgi:lipopolysaccharide/colanic/teichoic acid biosynthesis glycosyltransferase